jgi:hypothetical protein
MKKMNNENEIQGVDSEFDTENDHWNTFAFKVHCNAIEARLFEDGTLPFKWIDKAIQDFLSAEKTPGAAVENWLKELSEAGLSLEQRKFIISWVSHFIEYSEFSNDISRHSRLLKSYGKCLDSDPLERLVDDIPAQLKEVIKKEVTELPERLQELDPEKRLNLLCKLFPFVLPKVESVDIDR